MDLKRQDGFSLPEMLMSMAVFSLMFVLVGMILRGGEDHVRTTETKMNIQEGIRESLYRMALEIRESAPSRTSVLNGGKTLSFMIPLSVSNSGLITWSYPITYQVGGNGTQLIRTDTASGQTTVLANDIQSVAFAATGSPISTITYDVKAQRTMTNGRALTEILLGEAKLRNG